MNEPSLIEKSGLWGALISAGFGALALGIAVGALPWAWLASGGGATGAGLIAGALYGAAAVGLALGGPWTDRAAARTVLLATDGAAAVVLGIAALLAATGSAGLVAAAGAAAVALLANAPGSIVQDLRLPVLARRAGVPAARANALRDAVSQVGQVVGPVAGVLIHEASGLAAVLIAATAAMGLAGLVDAATFPRFRRPAADAVRRAASVPLPPDLRAGLVAIAAVAVVVVGALGAVDDVVAPALFSGHDDGAAGLARFLAWTGAGGLLSLSAYLVWGHRLDGRSLMATGLAASAVGLAWIAGAGGATGIAGPLLLGVGIGPAWAIVLGALQRRAPRASRGRAIGWLGAAVMTTQPAVSAAAGPAVDAVGPEPVLAGLAALVALAAGACARAPALSILSAGRPTRPTPPPATDARDPSIDVLRGVALLGIAAVNAPFFASAPMGVEPTPSTADRIADTLLAAFAEGRWFPVFSLLFGYGIAELARREPSPAALPRPLRRRMAALVALGALHAVLLFPGDILVLYGLLGSVVLASRGASTPQLLAAAALAFLVGVATQATATALLDEALRSAGSGGVATASAAGGWLDGLAAGLRDWPDAFGFVLLFNGPIALAMMWLGLLWHRHGGPDRLRATVGPRVRALAVAWCAIAVASAATAALAVDARGAPAPSDLVAASGWLLCAIGPLVAAGPVVAIVMAVRDRGHPIVDALASLGSSPLSGYLLQSVLFAAAFRAGSLGTGPLGAAAALGAACAVFVAVAVLLAVWHRRFRVGPAEWLLRSIVAGRRLALPRTAR